jgi:hypothetical protein
MHIGQVTDRLHDFGAIHPFFFDLVDDVVVDFFRLGHSKGWKADRESGCQCESLQLLFLFHDLKKYGVRKNNGLGTKLKVAGTRQYLDERWVIPCVRAIDAAPRCIMDDGARSCYQSVPIQRWIFQRVFPLVSKSLHQCQRANY